MSGWRTRHVVRKQGRKIMARLDVIQEAIAQVSADAAAEHQQVMDAIAALGGTITDLQAQVATLTAGQVTDQEIADLQATVQAADDQVKAIYEPETPTP